MLLFNQIWDSIFKVSVPAHYSVLSAKFSGQALFGDFARTECVTVSKTYISNFGGK